MISNTIQVNDLSCMKININGQTYKEMICFIYANNISLPLQKSNLMSNFNIQSITSLYFTLKNGYRLDCVDNNNVILFSFVNTSSDYVYYIPIVYIVIMIKVNLYDSRNILI